MNTTSSTTEETIRLGHALDLEANALHLQVLELVQGMDPYDLKLQNTQLNALKAVANAAQEPTQVARFVKYQALRHNPNARRDDAFAGWVVPAPVPGSKGTRDLSAIIADYCERGASKRAAEILAELNLTSYQNNSAARKQREVQLAAELVRRYILAFMILYRYEKTRGAREGANR